MPREFFMASDWYYYDVNFSAFCSLPYGSQTVCKKGLLKFFDLPQTRQRIWCGRVRRPACNWIQFRAFARNKPGRVKVELGATSNELFVTLAGGKRTSVATYSPLYRALADAMTSMSCAYVECWYNNDPVPETLEW